MNVTFLGLWKLHLSSLILSDNKIHEKNERRLNMFTKLMKIFTMMCWWQVHVPIQVGYIYKWVYHFREESFRSSGLARERYRQDCCTSAWSCSELSFPLGWKHCGPVFNVSSMLLPSLHAPSTWLPLRSSLSTKVFCTVGYLILIRLWRTQHVLIIRWAVDGRCPMVERKICKGKHVHIQ